MFNVYFLIYVLNDGFLLKFENKYNIFRNIVFFDKLN